MKTMIKSDSNAFTDIKKILILKGDLTHQSDIKSHINNHNEDSDKIIKW